MSEFEKWVFNNLRTDSPSFNRDVELAKSAWQAATAVSDKRIAELTATIESQASEIAELKAHINDLREALEENHYCNSSEKAINLYNVAISKTPAQSLQEHDNEVIERCAKVCDAWSLIGKSIAHDVRTLKG